MDIYIAFIVIYFIYYIIYYNRFRKYFSKKIIKNIKSRNDIKLIYNIVLDSYIEQDHFILLKDKCILKLLLTQDYTNWYILIQFIVEDKGKINEINNFLSEYDKKIIDKTITEHKVEVKLVPGKDEIIIELIEKYLTRFSNHSSYTYKREWIK